MIQRLHVGSNPLTSKTMASAEQLRALVKSHVDGDSARFLSVAMQVAAGEAKKGHAEFAAELRRMIDKAREHASSPVSTGETIQFAAPRGELGELLSVFYPPTRLSDMVLDGHMQSRLHRIIEEQKNIALIKGHNLRPRHRLLLSGPPGCGKTMTASAIAGELGLPLFVVRFDALITKFMGETSAKLRQIFDAMNRTRAVYLFDEFDSIGTERGTGTDVGEMRRVLNSFLVFLENYSGTSLIIAATNHGHTLDRALFRRFDDLIEFVLPEQPAIAETLKRRMVNAPGKVEVSFARVAKEAKGMSFAEVARACDEAIKETLLQGRDAVTSVDLLKAIRERRAFLEKSR